MTMISNIGLKRLLSRAFFGIWDLFDYRGHRANSLVSHITSPGAVTDRNSEIKVGILKEAWGLHHHYISACDVLGFNYEVIDMFASDAVDNVLRSDCSFMVARPSVQYSVWKHMFDNRLALLAGNLSAQIFPDALSLWLWESKLRTHEFLSINKIPHAQGSIIYRISDVDKVGKSLGYPLVYKADRASGSSGVKIFSSNVDLKRFARRKMQSGRRTYRDKHVDKEHGVLLLQQFHPNLKEWRIIRIGDYYFGFEKLKEHQFHSGSKNFSYGMPPLEVLNLTLNVFTKFDFRYCSVDVFVTESGELLVNEIQPYFGQENDRELLVIDGVSGRLKHDARENKWVFEKGEFCKHNLCVLRLSEMAKEYEASTLTAR